MRSDDRFFKYVRSFLTVYLPKQKCYSENTVKAYRDSINLLRVFLEKEKQVPFTKISFDLLDPILMGEFLDWLQSVRKCCASSRNQRLAALKALFKYAATEDPSLMMAYMELEKMPVQNSPHPSIIYMSEKTLSAVLRQPCETTRQGVRDRFFMIFMYDTGARVQELLDLRLKDLHLNDSTPCVYLTGKGNKTRVVPILAKTVDHLNLFLEYFHPQDTRKNGDLLFYTVIKGNVGKMSVDNVASFLKRYGNAARLNCSEVPVRVHPHLFRHTRAMHLYQMGMPLSYIKDFLGHSCVNTTDIYARADVIMLKDALEKVSKATGAPVEQPFWRDNEELILKLCGLK